MRTRPIVIILAALLFGPTASLTGSSHKTATEPIEIGSRLEPFVDDFLIESMSGGLSLRLHRPRLTGPVLKFDAPWEGPGNHYITVFKDGDLYRMYYRCVRAGDMPASGKGWPMNTCYAESRDGTHWTRPKLGLVEFEGSKENNIILTGPPGDWGSPTSNFFAFRDSNPQVAPEERYKGVGGINRGLYLLVSADGIHWKAKGSGPFMKHDMSKVPMINGFDSHNVIFWDAGRERYQAYLRDMYLSPGLGERTRSVRVTTSDDFVNWSYPDWIDMGEAPPDQLYTFSATPYFRAPHIYMAFPKRLMKYRRSELPEKYDATRGIGLSDSVFMFSRDGANWDRRYLEGFVRPGSDPLDWTDRSNYVAAGLVPTGSDEMSVYVLRHFRLPSIHLRRGVLRADGFVSVNATYRGGELVTRPLIFQGKNLIVNYATSAAGSVRVEIQDEAGNPVPGYRLMQAVEHYGNSIEQVVTWDRGSDLSHLAGSPVRLRILIRDGDLYSIRFK